MGTVDTPCKISKKFGSIGYDLCSLLVVGGVGELL